MPVHLVTRSPCHPVNLSVEKYMKFKQAKLARWLLAAGLACGTGSSFMLPGTLQAGDWFKNSPLNVDNCATIPRGAQPAPAGTYVRHINEMQSHVLAAADQFVLYK